MKPLEHPANLHLSAAQGWMELGDPAAASEELEKLPPALRVHPEALEVRWHICASAKKWEECVNLAKAILATDSNNAQAWIHRSYALHELKRTQEAFENLVPATRKFWKVWTIPYNLACYCAQLGRLKESEEWFRKAMSLDAPAARKSGIDDPDLKPLWNRIGRTLLAGSLRDG